MMSNRTVWCIFTTAQNRKEIMFEFLKDIWGFLKARKKWWLAPIIIMLLLMGTLLIFGGSSAVAPFIYSLF
jgi:Family of unknown function (DUF5989)